jgi:hypothetical protein
MSLGNAEKSHTRPRLREGFTIRIWIDDGATVLPLSDGAFRDFNVDMKRDCHYLNYESDETCFSRMIYLHPYRVTINIVNKIDKQLQTAREIKKLKISACKNTLKWECIGTSVFMSYAVTAWTCKPK